jgi:hypothetical protein
MIENIENNVFLKMGEIHIPDRVTLYFFSRRGFDISLLTL